MGRISVWHELINIIHQHYESIPTIKKDFALREALSKACGADAHPDSHRVTHSAG